MKDDINFEQSNIYLVQMLTKAAVCLFLEQKPEACFRLSKFVVTPSFLS